MDLVTHQDKIILSILTTNKRQQFVVLSVRHIAVTSVEMSFTMHFNEERFEFHRSNDQFTWKQPEFKNARLSSSTPIEGINKTSKVVDGKDFSFG